jgi:hypothetical protein
MEKSTTPADLHDDPFEEARRRADEPATPPQWGFRVALEPGDEWQGTWRGETVDEEHDRRRIFLLRDVDGDDCWHRSYASLVRQVDKALQAGSLVPGARVYLVRRADYQTGQENPGHSYGLAVRPPVDDVGGGGSLDDIPFR